MPAFERVLFLDIDGVLNTLKFLTKRQNACCMDPAAVKLLREVIELRQLQIVISSSWRNMDDDQFSDIRKAFADAGWDNPPIVGKTPDWLWDGRGNEIAAWLKDHPTKQFVILDDDADMREEQLPRFVRCDPNKGFTSEEAEQLSRLWS